MIIYYTYSYYYKLLKNLSTMLSYKDKVKRENYNGET